MATWSNFAGSVLGYIRLGFTGVRLKNSGGSLSVRNAADSSDAQVLPQSLGTGTRDDTKFLRDDGVWALAITSNRISESVTIVADTTYAVASYLYIDEPLIVDGNLLITG
jgi:hypothetical protein